jgi:peptidoglycan hydrolase CwlO-like protein
MDMKISKSVLVVIILVAILFSFISFSIDNILCKNVDEATRVGLSKVIQQQGTAIKQLIAKVLQGQEKLEALRKDLDITKQKLDIVTKRLDALTAG